MKQNKLFGIYLISAITAIGVSAIESVSYPGYILSHLHISATVFYLASIILSLGLNTSTKVSTKLYWAGILISITYIIMVILETITYPNYIFTKTHINLFTLQYFIGIAWFHISILNNSKFVKSLLVATLIFIGVDGVGSTLGLAVKGSREIIRNPFASYEAKMTKAYPGFYPAMRAIKTLTPEDSTILIPPQSNPWEIEGNAAMVTYFLYPRKVINLDQDTIAELPRNTYLLIAKGSWERTGIVDYGWPKVPVSAKRIWHIDVSSNINTAYMKNYDPNLDKWDWGLIEANNE